MAWRVKFTSHPLAWAVVASLMCLALLAVGLLVAPEGELGFLAWNLGLAWIPLALGVAILRSRPPRGARAGVAARGRRADPLLPNAPYLVTDLVHLRGRADGLPALDFAILAAFALTGLLLFVNSVVAIREAAQLRLGTRAARWPRPRLHRAYRASASIWAASCGGTAGTCWTIRWKPRRVAGPPGESGFPGVRGGVYGWRGCVPAHGVRRARAPHVPGGSSVTKASGRQAFLPGNVRASVAGWPPPSLQQGVGQASEAVGHVAAGLDGELGHSVRRQGPRHGRGGRPPSR